MSKFEFTASLKMCITIEINSYLKLLQTFFSKNK